MTAACPACVALPDGVDPAELPDAVQLSVPAVRCAACISTIETCLAKMSGVQNARVNLSRKRVQFTSTRDTADIIEALAQMGYEAFALDPSALGNETDPAGRDLLMRLGVSGFAMMNVMLLSVAIWSGASGATRDLFHLISATIAIPTVFYAAQPFFWNAWTALKVGRLNMDVPISLAIILAAAMSLFETLNGGAHAYFDAALSLTFFLLTGRYLEHRTRSAARSAAKELAALEVHVADRITDGQITSIPIANLRVGDAVHVATGMRVPVDGALISDAAHTDRSFLTGESDPVTHTRNATLNAGEINLGAPFRMRAQAVGDRTRLHQIARLIDTAENARNTYTSLADRAARIYAPAVHLLAAATFLGWMMVDGDLRHALNVAIAVLIITCPCALGLAVPAVSTAAISKLYKLGFLVKSGTALERLADTTTVIFDKTGTLTCPGFTFDLSVLTDQNIQIAKALAQTSSHPLAVGLDDHLTGIQAAPLSAIVEHAGRGVTAKFGDTPVALGNAKWLGQVGHNVVLQVDQTVYPLPYREILIEGAHEMVDGTANAGLTRHILSGDSVEKTAALAETLGINSFRATMSPEDKTAYIQDLTVSGEQVCMIGDGLNDAAALASATASIAPGSALDATRNAADVVVIGSTMADVPKLFDVARKTVHLSRQNFGIALAYNAVAIPIAVLGHATPLAAALAMSLSSITVLLNAMRIGRAK